MSFKPGFGCEIIRSRLRKVFIAIQSYEFLSFNSTFEWRRDIGANAVHIQHNLNKSTMSCIHIVNRYDIRYKIVASSLAYHGIDTVAEEISIGNLSTVIAIDEIVMQNAVNNFALNNRLPKEYLLEEYLSPSNARLSR